MNTIITYDTSDDKRRGAFNEFRKSNKYDWEYLSESSYLFDSQPPNLLWNKVVGFFNTEDTVYKVTCVGNDIVCMRNDGSFVTCKMVVTFNINDGDSEDYKKFEEFANYNQGGRLTGSAYYFKTLFDIDDFEEKLKDYFNGQDLVNIFYTTKPKHWARKELFK